MPRLKPLLILTVLAALLTNAVPARAQETSTSTSTSSTSSSTSSTSSTTSTTLPADGGDGAASGDESVAPEDVPQDPVVIPPPPTPPPPSPVTAVVTKVVKARLRKARLTLADARIARAAADDLIRREEAHVADLETRLGGLRAEEKRAIARLRRARVRLRQRAVFAYMSGGIPGSLGAVAGSVRNADRREGYVSAISTNDRRIVREFVAAKRNLSGDISDLSAAVDAAHAALDGARQVGTAAVDVEHQKDTELKMLQAGGAIAIGGFVFPVGDPHTFGSSFGAPRMTGTIYEHLHQGNDIFAPTGTPLLACERGVVIKMGTDVLGGTKLWLAGQTGTRYYYAHLSGYAPGIVEGSVVAAGTVVGFVGQSGNALGTPPHLHFEIHPGGGAAIDPYPILRTVDDATRAVRRAGG